MKYTFDYRNQTISEVLKAGVLPKTTYVGMKVLESLGLVCGLPFYIGTGSGLIAQLFIGDKPVVF